MVVRQARPAALRYAAACTVRERPHAACHAARGYGKIRPVIGGRRGMPRARADARCLPPLRSGPPVGLVRASWRSRVARQGFVGGVGCLDGLGCPPPPGRKRQGGNAATRRSRPPFSSPSSPYGGCLACGSSATIGAVRGRVAGGKSGVWTSARGCPTWTPRGPLCGAAQSSSPLFPEYGERKIGRITPSETKGEHQPAAFIPRFAEKPPNGRLRGHPAGRMGPWVRHVEKTPPE